MEGNEYKVFEDIEFGAQFDVKVEDEEIDDSEYQHMIPYEYRDYLEPHIEEEQTMGSRKRKASCFSTEKPKVECQKCGRVITMYAIDRAEMHAATHTNIKRLSCPVEECYYKCWLPQHVTHHMKQKHKIENPTVKDVVRIELSDEDKEEMRKIVDECFPGMKRIRRNTSFATNYKLVEAVGFHNSVDMGTEDDELPKKTKTKCQKCSRWIVLNHVQSAKRHAVTHTDLYRFECSEMSCGFRKWRRDFVEKHVASQHNGSMEYVKEKKITEKEEQELMDMVNMCFPGSVEIRAQTSSESSDYIEQNLEDSKSSLKLIDEMDGKIEEKDPYQDVIPYDQPTIEKPQTIKPKQEEEESLESIESKVEVIDEKDVKIEEIDDHEYQHMIPSENRDYLEEYPTHSKKIPAEEKKMLIDCQKCGNGILLTSFTEAKVHATTHTDLKSFKCEQMIDECFPGFIEQLLQKTDEKDAKIEEDDNSYQHMVPYEYQDIGEEHPLAMPTLSREISVADYLETQIKKSAHCRICYKFIPHFGRFEAENHAAEHTELKRFECSLEGCGYRSWLFTDINKHVKTRHTNSRFEVFSIPLNDEHCDIIRRKSRECFPSVNLVQSAQNIPRADYCCQVCHETINVGNDVNSKVSRRNHALLHTDIVLYSCKNCDFKTEYLRSIHDHEKANHGINSLVPRDIIEATDEQKMEIERMYNRCFPY